MAAGNRKKKFSIKIELSPAGLLGVGVVCFCIFLWMFLLGVWAGQTILSTGHYQVEKAGKGGKAGGSPRVEEKSGGGQPAPVASPREPAPTAAKPAAGGQPEKSAPPRPALAGRDDSSYFAVQVGAFREPRHAEKALADWRARGYKPFSRPPEGPDDLYTRVYVGRFAEVAEARKQAEELERKEKLKPFIATIPVDSGNNP